MTDNQTTRPARARKEAPHINVNAFIQDSTRVEVRHASTYVTLDFNGDDYGGVTLFFDDLDHLATVRDAINDAIEAAK